MFTHYLAGCLIFLVLGKFFGLGITCLYLIAGSVIGALPDVLSLMASKQQAINKWSHLHRDNLSHSILFPLAVFCVTAFYDIKVAIITGIALLSHPILDLFGIGWGVKLFYPLSNMQFKLFHQKGKISYTKDEIDLEVEKHGSDSWIQDSFFSLSFIALSEWGSLIALLILVLAYC